MTIKRVSLKSKLNTINRLLYNIFYSNETLSYKNISKSRKYKDCITTSFTYLDDIYNCEERVYNRPNGVKEVSCFGLELSKINKDTGKREFGWFLSPQYCQNDSYLFIWIDKARTPNFVATSDIYKAEIALVKRIKIAEYILSAGISEHKFFDTINTLENEDTSKTITINGIKFSKTENGSIYILLDRKVLKDLSDYQYIYIK